MVPQHKDNLELVEAHLDKAEGWDDAHKGVEYVIHVASPIGFDGAGEETLINDAVNGTKFVLESSLKNGIKKVVVTSSNVTQFINGDPTSTITDEDWSKEELTSGYTKSKLYAEKYTWEFHEKNKDKIDITTIHPGCILGPCLSKNHMSTLSFLTGYLNNDVPGVPDPEIRATWVDIRDCAEAHINALWNPQTKGQRYLLIGQEIGFGRVAQILRENFKKYGYDISDKKLSLDEIKKIAAKGVGLANFLVVFSTWPYKASNQKSVKDLGLKYKDVEKTIVESVEAMIDMGLIQKKN